MKNYILNNKKNNAKKIKIKNKLSKYKNKKNKN